MAGIDWMLVLLFVSAAMFVAGLVICFLLLLEALDEAKPTWPVISEWLWGGDE